MSGKTKEKRKEMNRIDPEKYLVSRGVRPTSNRILVMKELIKAHRPVSLADMEALLDYSMDKASIFRVFELFADKNVVHVIEDGSRSIKYELCYGNTNHSIDDQHAHFYCEQCKTTYCMENVKVPLIDMPEGFHPQAINYVVKGICPNCADT